jgi:hypothetical protein
VVLAIIESRLLKILFFLCPFSNGKTRNLTMRKEWFSHIIAANSTIYFQFIFLSTEKDCIYIYQNVMPTTLWTRDNHLQTKRSQEFFYKKD